METRQLLFFFKLLDLDFCILEWDNLLSKIKYFCIMYKNLPLKVTFHAGSEMCSINLFFADIALEPEKLLKINTLMYCSRLWPQIHYNPVAVGSFCRQFHIQKTKWCSAKTASLKNYSSLIYPFFYCKLQFSWKIKGSIF